jgi:RND family efflux transporter MFP subunit
VSSYYYFFIRQVSTTSTTSTTSIETVSSWSLKETIDVVWTSELVDEQSLKFTKAWTVTKVYTKAWDNIKKWETIAELDNTDWQTSIKDAQIALDNAKISLQELYKWADKSQILQSQNSITASEKNIEIAKTELENLKITQANSLIDLQRNIDNSKSDLESSKNSLELSKKDLELSQNQLDLTKKEQEKDLSTTESNQLTSIKQIESSLSVELTTIWKIIEQSDYILWVTEENKDKNDSYEMYLWASNSSFKNSAEVSLSKAITLNNELKIKLDSYNYEQNTSELKDILSFIWDVYKELEKTTDFTYKTLEASVSSDSFTESDLESKKSNIYSYKTTVQGKMNSINSSLNTLDTLNDVELVKTSNSNTITQNENSMESKKASIKTSELAIEKKQNDIDKLEKDLASTKKTYDLNIKSKEKSISDLQKALEVSKLSLNELLEWPTVANVKKAQNNITQAELKLKSANEWLDDYKLEAPFDWVVRKIDYMVWDNLTTDNEKYVYIENPNLLEIKVMLDQVDIAKVQVWTKALVKFDAYPTQEVSAIINAIDTTPVQSSWVTSYTVTIVLNDDKFDKKILSWMTADIEIITQEKNDVVVVSSTAISTSDNKSYVTVMKDWREERIEVQTWLVSSWKTEIISWLSIWDKIILRTYSASTSSWTTTKTSTSLFPTWSWRNSSRSSGWGWFSWPQWWF